MTISVSKDIISNRRDYFIKKVKLPLAKAINILAKKYPEPTKGNTIWHNTHLLIDFFEFLNKHDKNKAHHLFEAISRIVPDEYEHDAYYAFFLDLFIEFCKKHDWKPENRKFPIWHYWDGPLLKYENSNPDWEEIKMREKLGEI